MALNVDILSVNSLFINGVDILSNKRDYVELVGDEKIVIDVPSATYTKAIPQIGVNLGDVELKTTPLDGKTFDSINNAGGVSVDGVSHIVDDNGCYVSNINIDSFVLNKTSVIKSLDYTTYKWVDVDTSKYDLVLDGEVITSSDITYSSDLKNITKKGTGVAPTKVITSNFNTFSYPYSALIPGINYNGRTNTFQSKPLYTHRQVADSPAFAIGTSNFTIETWFVAGSATNGGIFQLGSFANNNLSAVFKNVNTVDVLYGSYTIVDSMTVSSGWHHLAIVKDGGYLKIFLDGTLRYNQPNSYSINPAGKGLYISTYEDTSTTLLPYIGYIDGIRISDNARYTSNFSTSSLELTFDINTIFYNSKYNMPANLSIMADSNSFKQGSNSLAVYRGNLSIPSSVDFVMGTEDFTIEQWVKPITNDVRIMTLGTHGSAFYMDLYITTSYMGFRLGSGSWSATSTHQSNASIPLNVWSHIVVQRKDSILEFFLNGVKIYSATETTNMKSGGNLYLFDYFGSGNRKFQGNIDGLRISKGIARYSETFTPTTSLLADDIYTVLKMDCESISDDNTTLRNVVSSNYKFKEGSRSLYFDGTTSLSLPYDNDFNFGTGNFTIEGWINLSGNTKGHQPIFSLGSNSSVWMSLFLADYSNTGTNYYTECAIIPDASNVIDLGFSNKDVVTKNTWFHIAVVRNGNVFSLYRDGVLIHSITNNNNVNLNFNSTVLVGEGRWNGENKFFRGYLDSFRVTKGVARYTSDFIPNTNTLIYDSDTSLYFDGRTTGDTTQVTTISNEEKRSDLGSYKFTGRNYISANANSKYVLGTKDFTIEVSAFVTNSDATNTISIIDNRLSNTNSGNTWFLGMNPSGNIVFVVNNVVLMTSTTTHKNKWVDIAITRQFGVVYLYINGIKESTSICSNNFTNNTFYLGKSSFTSIPNMTGYLDCFKYTNNVCRYTNNYTVNYNTSSGITSNKYLVNVGTVSSSDLKYEDYLVSYGTAIDPWVAVQPAITVSGEPFTTAVTTITSSSTFTSAETFNIGDIISSDKETFGTVIFEENGEFMVDADIFFDGVTDKPFTSSDANIVNFVKDKRSNLYTNGLRDALLSSVSSTIYGHINDEIIVDAGEGGSFILGTMYTSGGYQDTDTTSKFSISLSNDGVDYTVVYENQENLMTNHAHNMTGTGRFIKITFLNEMGDWGRIITNFVDGKWWDLHIVHPMSKVYRYAARLEVNGKSIVPNYIQWFDNMTINKIVCDKVFINPTTVLNINTENISKVELDLWQEVKGVI